MPLIFLYVILISSLNLRLQCGYNLTLDWRALILNRIINQLSISFVKKRNYHIELESKYVTVNKPVMIIVHFSSHHKLVTASFCLKLISSLSKQLSDTQIENNYSWGLSYSLRCMWVQISPLYKIYCTYQINYYLIMSVSF